VVIALEGGSGRGSARAPAGFRLYDALAASRDTLLGFGGHQAAAGVEIALDRVEAFRAAFASACAAQLEATPLARRRRDADARLDPRDDPRQVADDLTKLEPCGEANPGPRLLVRDASVTAARSIRAHLKAELVVGGRTFGAFGPDLGAESERLVGTRIDVVGRLKRDHFRGGDALELVIERFAPSSS
jgi:single-stranded-DNA-specific exonuclease